MYSTNVQYFSIEFFATIQYQCTVKLYSASVQCTVLVFRYSCPVCSYRICSGCAALDVADSASRDKNSLEILLARQFVNFGKNMKGNSPVESSLPGQVQ